MGNRKCFREKQPTIGGQMSVTDYRVQYQISEPVRNPDNGYYYQRVRMITDDGRTLSEFTKRSSEPDSTNGMFDPEGGWDLFYKTIAYGWDVISIIGSFESLPALIKSFMDLIKDINWGVGPELPERFRTGFQSWPGTAEPWDPSTENSDPNPQWAPGPFERFVFPPALHAPFSDKHPSTPNPRDPLVLDLTGAGIQLTSVTGSPAHFDFTGSGFAAETGWITSTEGLLVL